MWTISSETANLFVMIYPRGQRQVFSCELQNWPFLLQNLVAESLVPTSRTTSPMNSNQFEFLEQVPAIWFLKTLRVNCSWDKSL